MLLKNEISGIKKYNPARSEKLKLDGFHTVYPSLFSHWYHSETGHGFFVTTQKKRGAQRLLHPTSGQVNPTCRLPINRT